MSDKRYWLKIKEMPDNDWQMFLKWFISNNPFNQAVYNKMPDEFKKYFAEQEIAPFKKEK